MPFPCTMGISNNNLLDLDNLNDEKSDAKHNKLQ